MRGAVTADHTSTNPSTKWDSWVESTIARLNELFAEIVSKKVEWILEQYWTDEQRIENPSPIIRESSNATTNHYIQKLSSDRKITVNELSDLLWHLENPSNYSKEGDILQQTEETKGLGLYISILVRDVLTKLNLRITVNPSIPGKVVLKYYTTKR